MYTIALAVSAACLRGCIAAVMLLCLIRPTSAQAHTLWRIGMSDNADGEFTGSSNPAEYTVPDDWAMRTDWPEWKGATSGSPATNGEKWNTTITYTLSSVPAGGAEFVLKTIEANGMVPEVAVFSNRILCGIMQIIGAETPNEGNSRQFGSSYTVYIPTAFLQEGHNTLRLEKLAPTYNRGTSNRIYLFVKWDCFELHGLTSLPDEPLHGRRAYLGCVYGSQGFRVDAIRCDTEWKLWEWLGMAYCGNPIRAQFWSNLPGSSQPNKAEYLDICKAYNMTVVLDRLTDKDSESNESAFIGADGELTPAKRAVLDAAFADWGDRVQYYEISNEPCMAITKASFAVDMAIARYLRANAPAHWQTTAPGYTYGGGWGKPVDWDADDARRIELEAFCDATAGHSYGNSYYKTDGILAQTIDTYGTGSPKRIVDGFPVEVVLTECGTHHTSHKDFKNLGIGDEAEGKLRASMFDKNLRAHIAYADRILNFAMWDRDAPFRLLDGSRGDTGTWREHVYPTNATFPNPEVQNKLQVFRRLACAYATHGTPLAYTYVNRDAVEDRLVYVRAVNTAGLAPLPGSGAAAGKVLLNVVNFHHAESCTVAVRVEMPHTGGYAGVRIGPQPSYTDARRPICFTAGPAVAVTERIGPLEAVQYILASDGAAGAADSSPGAAPRQSIQSPNPSHCRLVRSHDGLLLIGPALASARIVEVYSVSGVLLSRISIRAKRSAIRVPGLSHQSVVVRLVNASGTMRQVIVAGMAGE